MMEAWSASTTRCILPNYGVFDENRYFQAGEECPVYVIAGRGGGHQHLRRHLV